MDSVAWNSCLSSTIFVAVVVVLVAAKATSAVVVSRTTHPHRIQQLMKEQASLRYRRQLLLSPETAAVSSTTTLPPNVGVTLDLSCVDQNDSGGDEVFRVTLAVTGAGGSSTGTMPMDVIFALDSSGSMDWNDPGGIRMVAAKSFVDRMDSSAMRRDKAGVVSWDDSVDFLQILSDDLDLIKSKIDNVDSSGGTDLNVGLSKAIALLDSNARNEPSNEAIIYLTDGDGSYTDCADNGPAAYAKSKNYTIYAIGLGTGANTTALQDMALCTGGIFFSAPTAANIHTAFDAIFQQITSSSSPHNIDVNAVINSCHSIDLWSITPTPKEAFGQNIIWSSIDAGAGLEAGQIVTLSFEARSSCGGKNVLIFEPNSNVTYAPFDYSIYSTPGLVMSLPDVSINVNVAPTAECKGSVKEANNMCQACFDVHDVDNGSLDMYTCPVHEPPTLSISWDADDCFDLGSHNVSMTARDAWALSSTCYTNVTVVDTIAPLISCNLPDGVIPSHVPLDLVPTALDNCPTTLEITGFECWIFHGEKKRKNESCIVSIRDDRLTATIIDSGGVGTMIHVYVKATDLSGNVQEETCIVRVVHPDHRDGT